RPPPTSTLFPYTTLFRSTKAEPARRAGLRLVANAEKKTGATDLLALLREAAGGRVRLAATMLYRGNDRTRLARRAAIARQAGVRSEEHTSELQSLAYLVC